jgi:quercetin dioxygenase-like cupin family protein
VTRTAILVDLASMVTRPADRGVVWSLDGPRQLDANLVHLPAGANVGAHDGHDVEVLLVAMSDSAVVTVDGHPEPLRPGCLVYLPVTSERSIEAGPDGIVYLTVRCRRGVLTIGTPHTDDLTWSRPTHHQTPL